MTEYRVDAFMPTPAETTEQKVTLFKEAAALAEINGKLMHNFVYGMYEAGLRPKRILLQTGCKGYGQHIVSQVDPNQTSIVNWF